MLILPDLMADIIFLLEWALDIDPNDIKANILLGKVYYLKSDQGEGYLNKKYYKFAMKYLSKGIKLNTDNKKKINQNDLLEAKKMLNEFNKVTPNAFSEEE